ncbi:hypothetical protein E2C01_059780 [Portunus trituberculatus]|uniref:Uncharacterized protein n=1 Tax=Portunus trituberculatus TaxID=210409 RepID=A0A5B7H3J2_PORTR|nr:hypothetical protein [Portunus trituberculatus]
MSPFRTCYFRNFEIFSALRTSAPRLVVRRYGGAEVQTEFFVADMSIVPSREQGCLPHGLSLSASSKSFAFDDLCLPCISSCNLLFVSSSVCLVMQYLTFPVTSQT